MDDWDQFAPATTDEWSQYAEAAPSPVQQSPGLSEAQKGWLGTTGVGRVLDAFKSGFAQPFHDGNLGLSQESTEWLKKVGTFPSDERKVGPITHAIESFNESMMVPAARDLDAMWRSVQSPFTGLAQGIGQIAEETGLATSLGYYPAEHPGSQGSTVANDILGALDTMGLVTGVHMELPTTVNAARGAPRNPLPHPDDLVEPPGFLSRFFKSEYGGGPGDELTPQEARLARDQEFDRITKSAMSRLDAAARTLDEVTKEDGALPPPPAPPDTPPLRPEQPQGPRKAGNINLDRINAPEDVKAVLEDAARSNDDFATARRGRMTFQDISDLADAAGMAPADLLKRGVGQAFNAEQAVAARNTLVASAEKLREMAKKAIGGTDEDMAAYLQAEVRHAAIQEQVAGMTAEAGRALASFNIKSEATERAKQLTDILEASGGRDNIQARINAINSLDTPEKVSRFIADSRKATTMDKIVEFWINGLLTGIKTQVRNFAGNTLTALNSVAETKIAEGIGALHGGEKVMPGEAGARAFASIQGAKEGLIAARHAWDADMMGGKVEARKGAAIGGKAGQIIRTPTRALQASDAFFKAIARRQELTQLAYRQATTEGLSGDALASRIADLVGSPSAKMVEKADKAADYQTFQKPLGDMGKAVQKFFAAHPVMKFVAPFIRTPVDIIKYAGERTPLGAVSKEWRDNLAGKNGNIARDTQAARLAMGTAVITSAFALAASGHMTGGGPKDTRARALLYMTGWQPYSVRVGDTLYSYQGLDPFATLLGAASDAYEIQHTLSETDASDIGGLLLASATRNLLNKTWLQGPADLMQAVEDPERYGAWWVQGLTSSFVPTIVADAARASDPYIRDARTIVDAIKAKLPGASWTLPVKNDLWGNPIEREGSLGPDMISPFYQTAVKNDVVAREMLRVGLWKPAVSRDIRGVDLSADQYDQYQKVAGKLTRFMLDAVVGKPGWNYLPAERQYEIMDKAFNSARETARNYVTVKNDLWGNPIEREGSLGPDMISPFYQTTVKNDVVAREMLRVGLWKPAVSRDIRGVDLSADQYDQYQKVAGKLTRFMLDAVVGKPGWNYLPAERQYEIMDKAFNSARETARNYVTVKNPDLMKSVISKRIEQITGKPPKSGVVVPPAVQ